MIAAADAIVVEAEPAFSPQPRATAADRVFRLVATAAAMVSLAVAGVTLVFLLKEGWGAISSSGVWSFFTTSVWNPSEGRFGIGGLLLGTIIVAGVAMSIAVPTGVGMAVFINEYAPWHVKRLLTSVVDLLAALPSVVFGLWGLFALQGRLVGIAVWLESHLSAIPLFRFTTETATIAKSSFVVGVVVAIMILPIITSVSRDVMAQVPREQCEGALALGGTRWGMVRTVILPFGKVGIVGAMLLGLGRALGETIAIAIIVNLVFVANWNILETGGGSIAALIASRFGEAGPEEIRGLIAAGFALFLLTFAVNLCARAVVAKGTRRS